MKKSTTRRVVGLAAALLPLSLLAVTSPSGASDLNVNVVGYSVVSSAFTALEKGVQATHAGNGITFTNSFGASTTQAEDVVDLPTPVTATAIGIPQLMDVSTGYGTHAFAVLRKIPALDGAVIDFVDIK